jgi:hypothetical protein
MTEVLTIELPNFPTHVPISKTKWQKIGYNSLHSSPHFTLRAKYVSVMHTFCEKHVPTDITLEGPIVTELIMYVPYNFGNVKSRMNKELCKREISWKKPANDYEPNWDLFNLGALWLKILDDCIVRSGILPDDNIKYYQEN